VRLGGTIESIIDTLKYVEQILIPRLGKESLSLLPGLYETAYHSCLKLGDRLAASSVEAMMMKKDILRKSDATCFFFNGLERVQASAREPKYWELAEQMTKWLIQEHGYRENKSALRDPGGRGGARLKIHAEKQILAYWWKNCYQNTKIEPIFFVSLVACVDCRSFFQTAAKALGKDLLLVDPLGVSVFKVDTRSNMIGKINKN